MSGETSFGSSRIPQRGSSSRPATRRDPRRSTRTPRRESPERVEHGVGRSVQPTVIHGHADEVAEEWVAREIRLLDVAGDRGIGVVQKQPVRSSPDRRRSSTSHHRSHRRASGRARVVARWTGRTSDHDAFAGGWASRARPDAPEACRPIPGRLLPCARVRDARGRDAPLRGDRTLPSTRFARQRAALLVALVAVVATGLVAVPISAATSTVTGTITTTEATPLTPEAVAIVTIVDTTAVTRRRRDHRRAADRRADTAARSSSPSRSTQEPSTRPTPTSCLPPSPMARAPGRTRWASR